MDTYKLQKTNKKIKAALTFISFGTFALLLAPIAFIFLCTHRLYDMTMINAIGITWATIFTILSFTLLAFGILFLLQAIKTIKCNSQGTTTAVQLLQNQKERLAYKSIAKIIISVVIVLLSIVPMLTIMSLRLSNKAYEAYSYVALFVLLGCGISIFVPTVLRWIIVSRWKLTASGELTEPNITRESPKKHTLRNIILIAAIIIIAAFLGMRAGSWAIQPYVATIPSVAHREFPIEYDKETGIYSITIEDNTDFRILQLTDIHLGGSIFSYSKDIKALETTYRLILESKPDLIIVTGDVVFPMGINSYSFNNYKPFLQFCSFMRNVGIPWAFTYGNHDSEFIASHTAEELNEVLSRFAYSKTGSLLYPDVQPDITGRSNQIILIKNSDNTINQALFLIDSNAYTKKLKLNDYDYIHDDQVHWYEEMVVALSAENKDTVSSLIFTHIPLREYQTAYNLYKAESSEVTYYFGKIGEANEAICCSDFDSKLFNTAVKLKSTKGIFVGHDHYNNISLEYQGIRLTYGMSIDYLAMPGISKRYEQRGATLILLKPDSTIDISQLPYSRYISEEQ